MKGYINLEKKDFQQFRNNMKRYVNQKVLLRKNLKIGQIVKILPNEFFLVSYYDDNNKFNYLLVSDIDIIEESEYEIIRNRINTINKILK